MATNNAKQSEFSEDVKAIQAKCVAEGIGSDPQTIAFALEFASKLSGSSPAPPAAPTPLNSVPLLMCLPSNVVEGVSVARLNRFWDLCVGLTAKEKVQPMTYEMYFHEKSQQVCCVEEFASRESNNAHLIESAGLFQPLFGAVLAPQMPLVSTGHKDDSEQGKQYETWGMLTYANLKATGSFRRDAVRTYTDEQVRFEGIWTVPADKVKDVAAAIEACGKSQSSSAGCLLFEFWTSKEHPDIVCTHQAYATSKDLAQAAPHFAQLIAAGASFQKELKLLGNATDEAMTALKAHNPLKFIKLKSGIRTA